MLSAVIFDFDGVIVDSEPLHFESMLEVCRPEGVTFDWNAYVKHYIGFDDRGALSAISEHRGLNWSAADIDRLKVAKAHVFLRRVREGGAELFPGVAELFQRLKAARVPIGLSSGALMSDVEPVLRQHGLLDRLDVIVTADQVERSKPDPASYRICMERLIQRHAGRDISAATTVAIEDTPVGIEAATGAELHVLAVTNSYPAGHLVGANLIVNSLETVSPDMLATLIDAR